MSEKFSIFGFGRDGVPCFFRQWFANGGDVAVDDHIWRTADQSDDAKTVSLVMDELRGEPERRLRARAMASGLISSSTMSPLPSARTREALGLPPRLNKFREFLEAAGREAFALAFAVLRDNERPKDERPDNEKMADALLALIARVDAGRWVLSENALHVASTQSWELVDGDTLRQIAPAAQRDTARDGVSRAAIKEWRDYPEYTHIVKEVGGHMALRLDSKKFLSDAGIRKAAMKAPAEDILGFVGEVPTVWSATPAYVAKATKTWSAIMPVRNP